MSPARLGSDPEIGERYRVTLADCCIVGGFTARVVEMSPQEEDGEVYATTIVFDNGVRLEEWSSVGFYRPDDGEATGAEQDPS